MPCANGMDGTTIGLIGHRWRANTLAEAISFSLFSRGESTMSELALLGGTPVRTAPFPTWPQYHPDDLKAIEEVLKSGRWGGNYSGEPGWIADEVAQDFAKFHDAKYGIPCMNGTIALEAALAAAG